MSKRKTFTIDPEQLEIQKQIIQRIRENNEIEYSRTGKQKYMHIITYGCQQNNSDTEKLKGMLSEMGYTYTENKEHADIILFNTCCVRENAEFKLYGNIGALKHLKANKKDLIIGICGCMMQQDHAVNEIKTKYKYVDLIFGTHNLYKFPELLERAMNEKYTLIDILDTEGLIVEELPIMREEKFRAWVTVMYGCNNFCSYCIVPYVRGRERSRTPENIIEEIKALVTEGCKEVTLLGQNVNSYGKDLDKDIDFADLLYMVNSIDGLERIRFMTSHPKDISDKLIYAIRDCEKVCEQLHLPFQAGSNNILKAMNRKYTKEEYLEKIYKIKNTIPEIALSTDIIVGFPGETEEDFAQTLDIVKEVRFDQAFMFIYSKRHGTPAAKMQCQVDEKIKQKNFQKLVELQNSISREINETYYNKIVEVLVEGSSKTNKEKLTGRTRTGKIVNFSGNGNVIGKLVFVKITEVHSWFLNGEMVGEL